MTLGQAFLLLSGGSLFLGLFLALYLATQEGRAARSQKILGLLILACALNAAHPVLTRVGLDSAGRPGQLFEPMQFLLAPLMTAYAASLVRGGFPLRARHLLHLLPTLLAGGLAARFTFHDSRPPWIAAALWGLLSVQMMGYLVPTVRILRRYHESLEARVSNLEHVDLNWLRWFFLVVVVSCLLAWGVLLLLLHSLPLLPLSYGVSLAMTGAVWVLGYRGLRQKIPETPILGEDAEQAPVERPPLASPESLAIKNTLLELLERKKPFLEPELGLDDLARLLEVPRNQLSAVINQELGVNFYDLVNGYRVRTFRSLLADPGKREAKLLTLAFEAGFNSKPTFNKVVLKQTGKTPSQLRQEEIESRPSR